MGRVFQYRRDKAMLVNKQIVETDKEIDRMVYELSEDELEIVKGRMCEIRIRS